MNTYYKRTSGSPGTQRFGGAFPQMRLLVLSEQQGLRKLNLRSAAGFCPGFQRNADEANRSAKSSWTAKQRKARPNSPNKGKNPFSVAGCPSNSGQQIGCCGIWRFGAKKGAIPGDQTGRRSFFAAPDRPSGRRRQNIHIQYDGLGFIPLNEPMKKEKA